MMGLKKPLTLGRSNKSPRKQKKSNDPIWSQSRRRKEKITTDKLNKLKSEHFYIHIDGNVYRKKPGKKLPLRGLSKELRKKKKDWKKIRKITKGLPVVIHKSDRKEKFPTSVLRRKAENKKTKKRKRRSSSSSSSLPPDLESNEMITYIPE